jgi:hypothetical protein
MNYNEKYGFITEMIPKIKPSLFLRRTASLLITFYTSYLFFHFVVLNIFTINNIFVIIASIWAGHIILDILTLCILKNRTCGDFMVGIKFVGFRRNINQTKQIAIRSIFSTTLFYSIIYCIYLAGWSIGVIIASLAFAIGLNCYKLNQSKLSIIDQITGSLALKK